MKTKTNVCTPPKRPPTRQRQGSRMGGTNLRAESSKSIELFTNVPGSSEVGTTGSDLRYHFGMEKMHKVNGVLAPNLHEVAFLGVKKIGILPKFLLLFAPSFR